MLQAEFHPIACVVQGRDVDVDLEGVNFRARDFGHGITLVRAA